MAGIERIGPEQTAECGCDEIIDVRSPREYGEDHLEGALSLPVLSDAEREMIGTLYRAHPFQARRSGAALIARNVARHLDEHFPLKPPSYRPLLDRWRGGQRSESLGTILAAVGWRVLILEGGYKAYRAYLLRDFEQVIQERSFRFRILAGLTGSGKTLLLRWMAERGHQVLDLEGLAIHRGSILGDQPGRDQPTQKRFEHLIWQALRRMEPDRPVYVESESNRIGRVHIPAPLWESLRAADVLEIDVPRAARARFLVAEYAHFLNDPAGLLTRIGGLRDRAGGARVQEWEERMARDEWEGLAADLLEKHYDPAYLRSRARIFREPLLKLRMENVSTGEFAGVAAALEEWEEKSGDMSRIRC